MASHWPEEVDVFSEPHSRMKKLVHKYSRMVSATDFADGCHMTNLLQNLIYVFCEFKAHEEIENILIMRNLKRKLKAASVTSAAVCNCHSDNRLTDMLEMVVNGSRSRWTEKSVKERQIYGHKLQKALENFTQNFLPHMEEEEEVFQPMLMQYFTYEELKDLKAKVIQQHLETSNQEKYIEDLYQKTTDTETESDPCHFDNLPDEVCEKIFSFLNPQDLCRSAQTCHRWSRLTKDASLWTGIFPVHWAAGTWTFHPEPLGGVDGIGEFDEGLMEEFDPPVLCQDEDADVDESSHYYEDDGDSKDYFGDGKPNNQVLAEIRILTSLVKHLLPCVGSGVKVVDLAHSKGLNSSLVHKILKLCPNIEVLDLTHTQVGDDAFYEYGVSNRQSKLRHLDLTNCHNITDQTLYSLIGVTVDGIVQHDAGCVRRGDSDFGLEEIQSVGEESDIEIIPKCCRKRQNANKCCNRIDRVNCESSISICGKKKYCIIGDCDSSHESGGVCLQSDGTQLKGNVREEQCDIYVDDVKNLTGVFNEISVENSPKKCEALGCKSEIKTNSDGLDQEVLETSMPSLRVPCCNSLSGNSVYDNDISLNDPSSSSAASGCSRLLESSHCESERANPNRLSTKNDELFCDGNRPIGASLDSRQQSCLDHSIESTNHLHSSDVGNCFASDQSPQNVPAPCCQSVGSANQQSEHISTLDSEETGEILTIPRQDKRSLKPLSNLQFLSFNGCYGISDMGLRMLSSRGGTPCLEHLDLSGCVQLTGGSVHQLISTCGPQFDHANLFYCDNISMDPFPTTASGCRNRGCGTRFCCSAD